MQNLNAWNAVTGKSLMAINTDPEAAIEIDKIMDMPFEEVFDYIKKEIPAPILKLKFGTVVDLYLNMDESAIEELNNLEEEDEPE